MEIIPIEKIDIHDIVDRLNKGETILYPTETCYGLGCDAYNQESVTKIFKIKERDPNKPVLMLVHDVASIKPYLDWTSTMENLAQQYWPGPLTLVVRLKNNNHMFAPGVVGENQTIAFRVTSHAFARSLCVGLGKPLVSTSANIAAMGESYDPQGMIVMFRDHEPQPGILIDAGVLPKTQPSTIVRVDGDVVTVLRQGGIRVD